jgi:hypothetical protein
MAEAALAYSQFAQDAPEAPAPRSRTTLLKRLTDVVCLPSVAGEHLRAGHDGRPAGGDAGRGVGRRAYAHRQADVPADGGPQQPAARLLLDEVEVARPLLEDSNALSDADSVAVVMNAGTEHRKLVARRRDLAEIVGEALLERASRTSPWRCCATIRPSCRSRRWT